MKIINNTTEKLADDLRVTIKKRSRVSMAAACFSVYAFEELKAQLENLDELRFIFTSPAFLDEKPKKAQREFYIPRLNRERTLHGSEFEIKLRSEFRQRAISQECAHWIREKARFKSNKTMEGMTGFLTVDSDSPVAYAPVNGFTREDLGCDRGGRMFSMINRVDTAQYLYDHVSAFAGEKYGLNTALVTGSVEGRTTIPKFKADLNNVLTCFSPRSKDKAALMPDGPDIDLLIATDCISEGQNLQDCDCLINYDIHWNPVRLVQRFGRIDRIGSKNDVIQLINFWPDMDLDSYINLKGRVETRMKALVMTSTGDDNLLSPEEQGNLEYRREQLKRLQTEVVDLEEMGTGVSITDLGLNEFRMEVMEYAKRHPELETTPGGISAVTQALPDAPAGVVFVLKNVHNEININDRNRLHPYYLVYLTEEGEIVYDHLSPRSTLETMRQLCHGKTEPIQALCRAFNEETRCGEEMQLYSDLLEEAVLSIVDAKEDSDLDSLFRAGGTTALLNQISGLDDFELICFLVVKEG